MPKKRYFIKECSVCGHQIICSNNAGNQLYDAFCCGERYFYLTRETHKEEKIKKAKLYTKEYYHEPQVMKIIKKTNKESDRVSSQV